MLTPQEIQVIKEYVEARLSAYNLQLGDKITYEEMLELVKSAEQVLDNLATDKN